MVAPHVAHPDGTLKVPIKERVSINLIEPFFTTEPVALGEVDPFLDR